MQARVGASFGGTEGAGSEIQKHFVFDFDVEKCPYLDDKAITNIGIYQERASKQSQVQVMPKLLRLKKRLEETYSNSIDPIEYLISLYYKNDLTTQQIAERTQSLDFGYKTKNGIQKLFKDTLKWELRDKHDVTERRKRRLKSKNNPSQIGLQKSREKLWEENSKKFHDSIFKILETTTTVNRSFSQDTFNSLKDKSDKIFYLLEVFEGISFKYICQISQELAMGGASLVRIINEKLEKIHKTHNNIPLFSLSPAMMHLLLQKAGVKK